MSKLHVEIDFRHPAYVYYYIHGLGYRKGRELESAGWQWARAFDGASGCWFHTDETVALPAFERLGLKPTVIPTEDQADQAREDRSQAHEAYYGDNPVCD